MLLRSVVDVVGGPTVAAVDPAGVTDDLAIRRVLARYCHVVDDGRFDELADLFVADGTFSFGRLRAVGRDGLRAWFTEFQPPDLRGST